MQNRNQFLGGINNYNPKKNTTHNNQNYFTNKNSNNNLYNTNNKPLNNFNPYIDKETQIIKIINQNIILFLFSFISFLLE